MLSVKQGGIMYHFLSLWYDSTWDWTPIFRTIGEHYDHVIIYFNLFFLFYNEQDCNNNNYSVQSKSCLYWLDKKYKRINPLKNHKYFCLFFLLLESKCF